MQSQVIRWVSRLCAAAKDAQILIDPVAADGVKDSIALQSFGVRRIRGFEHPFQIFVLARSEPPQNEKPGDLPMPPKV